MRRLFIGGSSLVLALAAIIALKFAPGTSNMLWEISGGGTWLLPLVGVSAVLDSVHPCSFSILLITIALLFGLQLSRGRILAVGGVYIFGIFLAYLAIGVGALQVFHLFNVPHFMGKLGAIVLILFGIVNLLGAIFPSFPLRLKLPSASHAAMSTLLEKATIPAAFVLGLLVGVCQLPCLGGPYLMVIGLLHDQVTYLRGLLYLLLYNVILILPLAAVLWFAADKTIVDRAQQWKKTNLRAVRLWAGIAMVALGIIVLVSL
ncbi:MAG: hypothetical protein HYS26_01835 [Candidatus Kaiserbacteria bacterium]|nr:MAG: hypothetical protein HYS26_01835 [Candidatus Kaiserbacteria bacterium]